MVKHYKIIPLLSNFFKSKKIKKCTKIQRIVIEYAIISEPDEASRQKMPPELICPGAYVNIFKRLGALSASSVVAFLPVISRLILVHKLIGSLEQSLGGKVLIFAPTGCAHREKHALNELSLMLCGK